MKQGLPVAMPQQRFSAKEKQSPEQQQMDVLRQLAGGPQILHAQPMLAEGILDENRRVQTKQRAPAQP